MLAAILEGVALPLAGFIAYNVFGLTIGFTIDRIDPGGTLYQRQKRRYAIHLVLRRIADRSAPCGGGF